MDRLSNLFKQHHAQGFAEHGATPKGVDWNDPDELHFRYGKMLEVFNGDFDRPQGVPRLLDVGCGWGGLYEYCQKHGVEVDYTGIEIVEDMVNHARQAYPGGTFLTGDVLDYEPDIPFDYVVCNAIMTQRLTATIPTMRRFCNRLIRKMFELGTYAIAFNQLSDRVNFTANNLYYRNPVELLSFCLNELSPRVKLDHGYSSLDSGRGAYYDFTVYVYKDQPLADEGAFD